MTHIRRIRLPLPIIDNNNAAAEIREAGMNGLSMNRLCFDTGIDQSRILQGMERGDFTLAELTRIQTTIGSWMRENNIRQAC